jgi:hypothetical protein
MSGCAQTSALSWATKIGTSPITRIPRSRAACRTAAHCSKNWNCSELRLAQLVRELAPRLLERRRLTLDERALLTRSTTSAARSASMPRRARSSRSQRPAPHERVRTPRAAARRPFFSKASKAFASSGRRCSRTAPKSTRPRKGGSFASSLASSSPARRGDRARSGAVAGEGRERRVGRVAEAGRPERQHLPERLPVSCRKSRKLSRRRGRARRSRTARAARWDGAGCRRRARRHGPAIPL